MNQIIDKSTWGPGPWQHEADSKHWTDPATGLKCAVSRHPELGCFCGYVGVPKDHPLFDWNYRERIAVPDRDKHQCPDAPFAMFIEAFHEDDGRVELSLYFQVHGGLTFAADHVPNHKPDGLWWFGFDCGHAGDLAPGVIGTLREIYKKQGLNENEINETHKDDAYRTMGYVQSQCEHLALKLVELSMVIKGKG